ncbi:hypothetical protein PAXINDRAFT_14699 [Paxillus involutus ATCC 200175]|uniref:Unplaced genomic scaffold PAXINscaffold_41, whole genome shotgun sequence n=1 Tax=Paxillus involutus ATCC 200175 TaxID=664439 RepID=A0A0C9TYX0_PAXIN|nr:hypothetical protein PAXINDRAFT_14699 [Paxillus involutus ATCC 200175]
MKSLVALDTNRDKSHSTNARVSQSQPAPDEPQDDQSNDGNGTDDENEEAGGVVKCKDDNHMNNNNNANLDLGEGGGCDSAPRDEEDGDREEDGDGGEDKQDDECQHKQEGKHLKGKVFKLNTSALPKPPVKAVVRQQWCNLKKQSRRDHPKDSSSSHAQGKHQHTGICGRPVQATLTEDESTGFDDVAMGASGTGAKTKCEKSKKFKNKDLPGLPETMNTWRLHIVPMFCDYTTTLDDPWEISDTVSYAQKLWNTFFLKLKHTVRYKDDPLKQQVYNWWSAFTSRAEKAVEAFFDRYPFFNDPRECADYVKWAVPEPTKTLDNFGGKVLIPPSTYPYMWKEFDNSDPDNLVQTGAFMHSCILDTFAFYLETIEHLPESQQRSSNGQWPRAALTLSTVAVERAFGQWDTGYFVPLSKADSKFSNKLWGYTTSEVMESVDRVSEKKWRKIYKEAKKYVGAYNAKQSKAALCAKAQVKISGRAPCYEEDSSDEV